MVRVGYISVHFRVPHVVPTLSMLQRLQRNTAPAHTVLVANHPDVLDPVSASSGMLEGPCEVIQHDNTGLEFGAYQAGLDHLLRRCDPDWVVIANDTFATHGHFSTVLRRRLRYELTLTHPCSAIVGAVVGLPRSFEILGIRTHRWVTSNIFAINRAGIADLRHRLYWPEHEHWVQPVSDITRFFDASVGDALRDHLEVWLFRTRPGPHWYASQPLDADNAERLARKARSILQEKLLSAQLDGLSAAFFDLSELRITRQILHRLEERFFQELYKRVS